MDTQPLRKIIWAVDAFEEAKNHDHALFLLSALTRGTQAEIVPVFILSPANAQVPVSPFGEYKEAFQALAEKRLAELVRTADLPALRAPVVLVNVERSMRLDIQILSEHAKRAGADVILVATHARRGLSRMLLGSFAESLVIASAVPVITINPEAVLREKISKILFPTNFQMKWRPSFEKTVELAKGLGAEMTLFYKEPFIGSAFMRSELQHYLDKETAARQERAQQWKNWAVDRGVSVTIRLDNEPGPLVPAIQELAESSQMDLISMATQEDAVSAFLVGSATRQMIRHAPCPVWVMRCEKEA